ncbi:NDP-hexose 2,3-dehydratase family protein [Vibrio cyclitrophicus]
MKNRYNLELNDYLNNTKSYNQDDRIFNELAFERIYHNGEIQNIINWYESAKQRCTMNVEQIPLLECEGWHLHPETGALVHKTGEFFRVEGIRITSSINREVSSGWEQPILTQVGFDGGILGLIRKRRNGLPHYLVEAKSEPGNPGIVQISTTVQATFSNLKRAHGGTQTLFSEYFLNPIENGATVIFERWMSEDGGRLFNKRNKSMIVEIEHELDFDNSRFKWVTMNELIRLIRSTDAIVAPHVRGILSGV